jgi:hypothetical protein
MLPLEKFLFVSRGLSNDNKTMPGNKYFLITSTPEEIMNYGNNEYEYE